MTGYETGMAIAPKEFDAATIEWGPFMWACYVTLLSKDQQVGFIHIRAADDAPREQISRLLEPLTKVQRP